MKRRYIAELVPKSRTSFAAICTNWDRRKLSLVGRPARSSVPSACLRMALGHGSEKNPLDHAAFISTVVGPPPSEPGGGTHATATTATSAASAPRTPQPIRSRMSHLRLRPAAA